MSEVAKLETQNNLTPMELIAIVVKNGSGLDQLGQLMTLHRDHERYEAEKAFNHAMAMFQADPPEIFKNQHVEFGNTKYDHASLDHAVDQIREKMKALDLMFTWDVEALDDGDQRVTCVIRHKLGHSSSTSIKAPPDKSGQKNTVQSIASTITYLQRYTLLAATGCAPKHLTPDNDGRPLPTTESTDDADDADAFFKKVRALLSKQYSSDEVAEKNFCKQFGIKGRGDLPPRIEDLPRGRWQEAIKLIDARAKRVAEEKAKKGAAAKK